MAKDVTVSLLEKMQFRVDTGSGHALVIDASPDVGGAEAGPRPMELQLAALAGCSAMDVISILRKMRQDVTVYEVSAHGETAPDHPQRYTEVVLIHRVGGDAIREDSVRRAIELSMTRYCPVYAMLSPGVRIVERYEVRDGAGNLMASGDVAAETASG